MYQGIFDTDFDKYIEDACSPLRKDRHLPRPLRTSKDFRRTGRRTLPAIVKFVREHQCPSFLEYGEYPYVSCGRNQEGP